MTFWKRQNYKNREQSSGFQGLGLEGGLQRSGRNVLDHDYGGGYITVRICPNSELDPPKRVNFTALNLA